jgi:DUF4097 and DUF4098 domain-containing protein YvlB
MILQRIRVSARIVAFSVLVGMIAGCEDGMVFTIFEPLHEETRTANVPHESEAAIEVNGHNGSVVVRQSDRDDVQVETHIRALSPERLAGAEVVTQREESGKLRISVAWPEGKPRNREGCRFEVLIPEAAGVTLRTQNGEIELGGLAGEADLHTSNGSITVKGHDGQLKAKTSNGRIHLAGVRGAIGASTSNGRIEIADAITSVNAKTSNGGIAIALSPEGPGPIEARTSNGSITLELSPTMRGQMSLTTSNGSVKIDPQCEECIVSKAKTHAELDFGSSEHHSTATTSNGSIHVKRLAGLGL